MKSNIFTAAAVTYLLKYDFNVHHQRYIDSTGNVFSPDTVDDAIGFTTNQAACEVLSDGKHSNCYVVEKPVMDVLVYRVDEYFNNMSDLNGFFLSKDDAEHSLRTYREETLAPHDENFGQITCFGVSPYVLDGVDVSDNKAMLAEAIWGEGNIVEFFYYAK